MHHERIASTFDRWAADGRDASMERGHGDVVAQVLARLGVRPGERILELGCGNGWATRLLAKAAPGVSAVGVDVSPAMIARAEVLHSHTLRARYEVMPFERLAFGDASFDRLFSMEALYYAADLPAALAEAHRVLRPGAVADVVVDYYRESPGTECWSAHTGLPMHYLGQEEWRRAFEAAGFPAPRFERVIDSRGPGTRESFRPSECAPDWETHRAIVEAGSLWIHAERPGD
jgi:arsenite methyltransferase